MTDKAMGFLEHLRELRKRLIISVLTVTVGTFLAFPRAGQMLDLLMKPVLKYLPPGEGLKFFGLADAFALNIKISLWAGLILTSPITLYQIWAFCAPGLNKSEKRKVPSLVFLATFLLLCGVAFAYFLVWPVTFGFFLGFSTETIQPMLAGDLYLSLALGLVAVFALAFQLPLILMFLGHIGLITPQLLKKFRPYAVIIFFIIGAILTPPEAISQCFLALTLILLYELSIFLMRSKPKTKHDEEEDEEDEPEEEADAEKESADNFEKKVNINDVVMSNKKTISNNKIAQSVNSDVFEQPSAALDQDIKPPHKSHDPGT
jgi:sec-independent protein translocase protein TatC